MRTTTAGFKTIMASGNARKYVMKIDLTLADNTVLNLTEEDIWEDSFAIETASSGTSSFDIGTAVIGQCKFTINNINGDFNDYDFFNANAVVWLGLVGDETGSPAVQQYYRMGFYTVDEPQKANGLIALTLLDNMWKFDVPFSEVTINYPATVRSIIQTMCTYCGVTLSANSQTFHGYDFTISEAPQDTANMNCREMLQYLAMIGCNFCVINDSGDLVLKWYDVNATTSTTDVFELNQSSSFGTEDIQITGVKFVIDNTEYTIGSSGYVLQLENPLVNANNVSSVLNLIWATGYLKDFTLRTFNLTTASDLAAEIGDKCKVKDYKGNYVYSWITLNSFKTAGHLIQCNAEAPNRTLVKRYSKAVQAAVAVAREQANEVISNYDLAVQMMNDLAVNAMGGYEDYEDLSTGGRVWYLSNMPITKVDNVCSFEPNSTVFKRSGSGFFVSRDGGTTWVNGYDIQTGELVVNVLDAIGINFDWARGGTLTLGGYGNGNGELSIQNSSNVEKVHGDNTGLKVGANTGSKMHLTTDGELAYYYDNTYNGKLKMESVNYGTQSDPDYEDTLSVEDFSNIKIQSDSRTLIEGDSIDIDSTSETRVSSGGMTAINGGNGVVIGDIGIGAPPTVYPYGYSGSNDPIAVSASNLSLSDGSHYQTLQFYNGMLCSVTQGSEVPHDYWHSWESGGVTYDGITLVVGNTTATFPDIDTTKAYYPYIECADNVEPPQLTGQKFNGTNCIVTFTAVTSAQAGSGQTSACIIKLRAVV